LLAACGEDATDATPDDPSRPACYAPEAQQGQGWQDAFDATSAGALLSVWGPDPCDLWTVGGQPEAGAAFHFDGKTWERASLPADLPLLNWVYGFGDEVWIVGNGGTALQGSLGALSQVPTGVDGPLWGVWGAAPDDVWSVGGDVLSDTATPILIHWDGSAWSSVELPAPDRPSRALFKVWGTSADNVFAVGHLGLVYRFDGQTWSQVPSGTGEDLISLWGRAPDDIAIIGGRANGVLARWDGAKLTSQVIAGLPGMNGIWMDKDGVSHVVGSLGALAKVPAGSFEPAQEFGPTQLVLHGTFGFDDGGPRFAVGGSLARNPPYVGVALTDP
jgi:hypothetical protein